MFARKQRTVVISGLVTVGGCRGCGGPGLRASGTPRVGLEARGAEWVAGLRCTLYVTVCERGALYRLTVWRLQVRLRSAECGALSPTARNRDSAAPAPHGKSRNFSISRHRRAAVPSRHVVFLITN